MQCYNFILGDVLTQENFLRLIGTFNGPRKTGSFSIGENWFTEIDTYFGKSKTVPYHIS